MSTSASEAVQKFWLLADAFRAAPPSEKSNAFFELVRRTANLIVEPDFPRVQAADRLKSVADTAG